MTKIWNAGPTEPEFLKKNLPITQKWTLDSKAKTRQANDRLDQPDATAVHENQLPTNQKKYFPAQGHRRTSEEENTFVEMTNTKIKIPAKPRHSRASGK